MNYGFIRAVCAAPETAPADCAGNAERIICALRRAADEGAALAVFPELCITGYTCGDLFLQQSLQRAALAALERIAGATASLPLLAAVGLPVAAGGALYNAAALVSRGRILALIPKTYLPNCGEFYEKRWFAPAPAPPPARPGSPADARALRLSAAFPAVPFGARIIAEDEEAGCALAAELCEDLWAPVPPSAAPALSGASVIINLSASNEVIGKAEYRRMLVRSQSARLACAYLYAGAGPGESTTDMVFGGHCIIAENGALLAESPPFADGFAVADIDLERLAQERRRWAAFADCARDAPPCRTVRFSLGGGGGAIGFAAGKGAEAFGNGRLRRAVDPRPFVPAAAAERDERCREIADMQARGLAKRLAHTKAEAAVVGVSGGLDSALALLVTARAFALLGKPARGIIAVSMPCFGTTARTRGNAASLARALGATLREIPLERAVRGHLADIGHDERLRDITYENAQARERTQVLMDTANQAGGIVVGTGDLSELALGWATYNGDHMSMYGVNASVPKTLVRYLVEWFMATAETEAERETLRDILDTPVSPELLPAGADGEIAQKTESIVGPYELHDFFLYYTVRWGFAPGKILFLAEEAFRGVYARADILPWLAVFYRRFFAQQFKRSCLPDGPKVGTVSLSPRGDWRMPSDAEARGWLQELHELEQA